MAERGFLDRLADLRTAHCDRMPTPEMAVLARATARLRRSGILYQCLQPGETAPDFSFIDHNNSHQSLYGLLEQGPVIINFFRGFWCMYCKTEFDAFSSIRQELDAQGCFYLAISPQNIQGTHHYHTIYDKNNRIARRFNIVYDPGDDEITLFKSWDLNINELNESANWSLPIPATYIIAMNRTVVYQFADVDIRTRCCPDELLEELRQLRR